MLLLAQLSLLGLLFVAGCLAAQPRQLARCPTDFETLVEPLPAAVGDTVLQAGPGVHLRTVGFLRDAVLRVDAGRLLLNQSVNATQGLYNGPHIILCSDDSQPLVTFSLFFKLTGMEPEASTAPAVTTTQPPPPPTPQPGPVTTEATSRTPSPASGARVAQSSAARAAIKAEASTPLVVALVVTVCFLLIVIFVQAAALLQLCLRRPRTKNRIYNPPVLVFPQEKLLEPSQMNSV